MKHHIVILFVFLASLSLNAQYIATTPAASVNSWSGYTSGGQGSMMHLSNGSDHKVTIYDQSMNVVKAFAVAVDEDARLESLHHWASGNHIGATQHLFNDDDLWEVVVRTVDKRYEVYNEQGRLLGEIPDKALITLGDTTYLGEFVWNDSDPLAGGYRLYSITPGVNSLQTNVMCTDIRVYPNPVSQGEMITFELPDGFEAEIEIYDTAGRLQYIRTTDGASHQVSASQLPVGVLPYKVTTPQGSQSSKLIVR